MLRRAVGRSAGGLKVEQQRKRETIVHIVLELTLLIRLRSAGQTGVELCCAVDAK